MAEQARVIHRDDRRTSDVIGPSSTGVQPAPLTSTCSSTRSDATTALDGQKQQPQPEYPKSPLPPIQTPENDGETSQNVAVRFLHATQNVLLSSYVNILLVFVPVGIAARESSSFFSRARAEVNTLTWVSRYGKSSIWCSIRYECGGYHAARTVAQLCYRECRKRVWRYCGRSNECHVW